MSKKGGDDDVIKKLVGTFFKGTLLIDVKPEELKNFTWDKQLCFLEFTVYRDSMQKYPVNSNFCGLFFKKLICLLEPLQEVHDGMYEFLCSVMNTKLNREFYYRHYLVNDNIEDEIIIQETKNTVFNGTTGLKTWEAALILADWALCNRSAFANKKVLELGSGVGFTGIAIAKHCDVVSMTMSDSHPDVLTTLKNNIKINFSCTDEKSRTDSHYKNGKTIEAIKLDWNNLEDLNTHSSILPDVIIGADIVYDPSILKPLCNVLKFFCQRNPNLEIYICSIIRIEDTLNAFLALLETSEFSVSTINHLESVSLHWDKNIKKCLVNISKKY